MPLKKIKSYVSDALKRSREKIKRLEGTIDQKSTEVQRLKKENERLKKENAKLKDELKAARKPPSWAKPNKGKTAKPGKKKGPKKGHKPNKRKPLPTPHQEIEIIPLECPNCEHTVPKPSKWHEHTQIDIPQVATPIITTFHTGWSWCACCDKYVSVKDKLANTLYGPRLHAHVSYLKFKMGLTLGKIQKLVEDQFGLWISTGQLSEMIARTADKLEPTWEDLKTSLLDQNHLHADETGWRIDGNNGWLWSFANDDVSFYTIDKSRGQKVVERVLGRSFGGVLTTDFYSAYNPIECAKQKCWPHLLRDLKEVHTKYPRNQEIRYYLDKLKRFFERGKALKQDFSDGEDIDKRLCRLKDDTQRWADKKHRHFDLKRISKRLRKYRNELYTFIKAGTDPTNNFAEREIRPAVLMRKMSYGNRSVDGARHQSILMSVINTADKHKQSFVETTTDQLKTSH